MLEELERTGFAVETRFVHHFSKKFGIPLSTAWWNFRKLKGLTTCCSSTAEHAAVARGVAGSTPANRTENHKKLNNKTKGVI